MNRKIVVVWLSLLIIVSSIVILVEIAPIVHAPTTLYVGGAGGGNYSKIQWAIDNASDGDTVFVYNGTYYENVVVSKTINLIGEDKSNVVIDGGGSGDVVRINVDWINMTGFTIKNCGTVHIPDYDAGIELYNAEFCKIYNNNISSNYRKGICLRYSSDNNIMNNYISNNWDGIYIRYSSMRNIIQNNNITLNDPIGIYVESSDNKMLNNSFSQNICSIQLEKSPSTEIVNNTFINESLYITGDSLTHYNSHTIPTNNKINGKPLYYYSNSNGFNIDGIPVGALVFANCTDINIENITVRDAFIGIEIAYSTNVNIIQCNFSSNYRYGIYVTSSSNNNILNNNLSINWGYGIYSSESSSNTIINNYVTSNGGDGICLHSSSYNEVQRNYVSSNINDGISIWYSSYNNLVIENEVLNNNDYGIYISASPINNYLYHNNIIGNVFSAHGSNQIEPNYWDNGYPFGGNHWSDYTGDDNYKGPNQDILGIDGIGDTPDVIDSNEKDNYPLMQPYNPLENFTIFKQGWNLISIPLVQVERNITRVLGSIDSWYDAVQWYNISDTNDHWKHNKIGKPFGNDLFEINETMGFWIHITQPGDTIFVYNGTQPTSNQTIQLYPGWNLVGYPSNTSYNRTIGLNNLTFGPDVDAVQWYDASTQTWHDMGPDDLFVPGRGYWVHANVECEWEVPL